MENILSLLVLVSLLSYRAGANNTKRLLLHSDLDIATEVTTMKLELAAKDKQITDLQQNFTSQLSQLQAAFSSQLQSSTATLTQKITTLQLDLENKRLREDIGSNYIRWGRTTCDGNGTQLVYSGYTGGSHYNEEGSAANAVCLPEHPTWAKYVDGLQNIGGHMYGTEYNADSKATFNPFNFQNNDDAPCAVCRAPYTTTLMIPAKTDCYPGWNLQYTGYLMTGYYGHKGASEFICVDGHPEAELHGEQQQLGKLLYFVEAVCGSLPCQRYPNGRELACVVCSK